MNNENFNPQNEYQESDYLVDYDAVESKHVLELIAISKEYIQFISDVEKYDKRIIINYLHKIFPLIYLKSSLITNIRISDDSADERFVTEEEYESIYFSLKDIFNPAEELIDAEKSVEDKCPDAEFDVAEYLSDIYQDLSDFYLLYSKELISSQECSIRNIKLWFEERYGFKILKLLSFFHSCLYGENLDDEEYNY